MEVTDACESKFGAEYGCTALGSCIHPSMIQVYESTKIHCKGINLHGLSLAAAIQLPNGTVIPALSRNQANHYWYCRNTSNDQLT